MALVRYLILDMASLRTQQAADRSSASVLTCRGEVLSTVLLDPDISDAEAVFQVFDDALDRCQLTRPNPDDPTGLCRARVALYNPFTAHVSVGPVPDTQVFTDNRLLNVPAEGLLADLETTQDGTTLTCPDLGRHSLRTLNAWDPVADSIASILAAHDR